MSENGKECVLVLLLIVLPVEIALFVLNFII